MGIRLLGSVALLTVLPTCGGSQIHPSKAVYADWESWAVTTPADVRLGSAFEPFRAVWSREYRNVDGELRSDHVVLVAEELSWYGRSVLSLTLHDAGALESPDTNARTATIYVDRENLSFVRAVAPTVGSAEDYTVMAARDDAIVTTRVSTESGTAESTRFETEAEVFGGFSLEFLVWAALGLEPGGRAVTHLYSPGPNGLAPSIIQAIGTEQVELPDGETAEVLVIERPIPDPSNGRMHHFRLLDRAPYLASRHLIDLDTGETSFHFRLVEWQRLVGP